MLRLCYSGYGRLSDKGTGPKFIHQGYFTCADSPCADYPSASEVTLTNVSKIVRDQTKKAMCLIPSVQDFFTDTVCRSGSAATKGNVGKITPKENITDDMSDRNMRIFYRYNIYLRVWSHELHAPLWISCFDKLLATMDTLNQ